MVADPKKKKKNDIAKKSQSFAVHYKRVE